MDDSATYHELNFEPHADDTAPQKSDKKIRLLKTLEIRPAITVYKPDKA